MVKFFFITFLLFVLNSCSLGFAVDTQVVGNYHLIATDAIEQMSLSYCEPNSNGCSGIIEPTVFSVGFNKDYIIAKQHPNDNRNTTNYFIVPINPKKRVWVNYFGTIGPLSLNEFNNKIAELNIQDIKFSITEKSLQ